MKRKKFEENTKGTDYVVGDLHGCYDLFEDALASVNFNPDADRVFCVGDLIDRGPYSYKCLQLLNEPWFHSVLGNHELFLLNSIEHGDSPNLWVANGGIWAFQNHLDSDLADMAKLILDKMYHTMEISYKGVRIGIVHAEPLADWETTVECSGEYLDEILWSRRKITLQDESEITGIDLVIVGHTIVDSPAMLGNVLYIDTGAFHTDRLTLLPLSNIIVEGGL